MFNFYEMTVSAKKQRGGLFFCGVVKEIMCVGGSQGLSLVGWAWRIPIENLEGAPLRMPRPRDDAKI